MPAGVEAELLKVALPRKLPVVSVDEPLRAKVGGALVAISGINSHRIDSALSAIADFAVSLFSFSFSFFILYSFFSSFFLLFLLISFLFPSYFLFISSLFPFISSYFLLLDLILSLFFYFFLPSFIFIFIFFLIPQMMYM